MSIKFGRILLIAIAAEVLAIIALVLIVAIFGPVDPEAAQAYAKNLGYWVGPIAGFIFCGAGGWLASKNLTKNHILNGFVLGSVVAVIDISLIIASGSEFQLIFVFSNLGRLIAGIIGGWIASRGHGAVV